jgi:hypothetical protein
MLRRRMSGWFKSANSSQLTAVVTPKKQSFRRAYVAVVVGDRKVSNFMAAAGLGLTGAGVKKMWTIDYAPSERVSKARVRKAMEYLQEHDKETNLTILDFEVLCIETVKA